MRLRWPCVSGLLLGFLVLTSGALFAEQAPANKPDLLHQLNTATQNLVRKVSPSVVQVLVTGFAPLDEKSKGETGLVIARQRSIGSGVVVDPAGYVITNAHVVGSGGRIQVTLPAGNMTSVPAVLSARGFTVDAHVVGMARELDLALLRVNASGLQALPIAKYSNIHQGELVFAFGTPEGLGNSVTMGVVSSVARQLDPDSPLVYIQTDAPINPGNSGGPLVNADGELVGLSTFILSQSGGNEGLGFAIPGGMISFAYPQLKKWGHVHRGEIGVSAQTITPGMAQALNLPRDWGVVVSDVLPGGPADSAGLKIGDVILSVNGFAMDSMPLLGFTLFTLPSGEKAQFDVLRGGQTVSLQIPVVEHPHGVDKLTDLIDPEKNVVPELGILALGVDPKVAEQVPELRTPSGVIVVAKTAASDWGDNELTTGDVIHALNGMKVSSIQGLESQLKGIKPGTPVVLQIERGQQLTYLTLRMD